LIPPRLNKNVVKKTDSIENMIFLFPIIVYFRKGQPRACSKIVRNEYILNYFWEHHGAKHVLGRGKKKGKIIELFIKCVVGVNK